MTDDMIRNAAMNFEAVKVSMSQDKNGIILRLNVHPNDCPKELHTDWVGTRYMVAMVKLQDDDTVDDRGYVAVGKMIASAGMLCRNADFHSFLSSMGAVIPGETDPTRMEMECIEAIHAICGITSRTEFRENEKARNEFEALRQSFKNWKQGKSP